MKHVIVIETVDEEVGGKQFPLRLQQLILGKIENLVEERHGVCFIRSRFNVLSAIAATREMYNAPAWDYGASAYEKESNNLSR